MTTPLHADLSDAQCVVDAMREYIEQEVEPGLDILERWADRIHAACTHGAALLEAAGREGFVLVPRELTPDMIEAFAKAPSHEDGHQELRLAWSAMLAAAPSEASA